LLQTADLYVHYAAAENCPMVLLEASRAGLPWAGRPSGGVGELARALHGTALSPDSIEQSVDILRPLLADKSLRQSVGQQTRECFLSGFTRQAMTDAYIRALGLNLTPRVAA
jgi:glycosyltransferase involved in cell wall biosynthesis